MDLTTKYVVLVNKGTYQLRGISKIFDPERKVKKKPQYLEDTAADEIGG